MHPNSKMANLQHLLGALLLCACVDTPGDGGGSGDPDVSAEDRSTDIGHVNVSPNPIDFGRVLARTCNTLPLTISNSGTAELTINDLFFSGSYDFGFTETFDVSTRPVDPEMPIPLDVGDEYTVDVTYCPDHDGRDEANLLVRSDDASTRTVTVSVLANTYVPCLTVTDETGIDYGRRLIGESHVWALTITNCSSTESLRLDSISLGSHWELPGEGLFGLLDSLETSEPLFLEPLVSESMTLSFTPLQYTVESYPERCDSDPCEVSDGAVLTIRSNDEPKDPLEIEVQGVGSLNPCPTTVALARVQGSGDTWDTRIDTNPLVILELDGSDSMEPDGTIETYQWEVVERPEGSAATFAPGPSMATPTFFLDAAGAYTFRLTVYDQVGSESCEPAEILAVATPAQNIYVQLFWGSEGDQSLHFVHPNGTWNSGVWDCFSGNPNPDWGIAGTEDDPSLDIFSDNGWGPEVITLDNPEGDSAAPVTYSVGVHYFDDLGAEPNKSTVRIYVDGIERFHAAFPELQHGQFWDVARVSWPTGDIEGIHRLYPSGFP